MSVENPSPVDAGVNQPSGKLGLKLAGQMDEQLAEVQALGRIGGLTGRH